MDLFLVLAVLAAGCHAGWNARERRLAAFGRRRSAGRRRWSIDRIKDSYISGGAIAYSSGPRTPNAIAPRQDSITPAKP